jgi:hypothetical protein
MAITKQDRYFGEGISSQGEENPHTAFTDHLQRIREKRVIDAIGADRKLSATEIVDRYFQIKAAIEAADKQVINDNTEFMQEHGIKL